MKLMENPIGTPPAKRAKRLPAGMVCDHCGGRMKSLAGYWLARGEYVAECEAGCWTCADCADTHGKGEICLSTEPMQGSA
jgi:hypothetical protein